MRKEEFRAWLAAQDQASGSISTRISDASRVEALYGDLDTTYDADKFESLLGKLTYTAADRASNKPNLTRIEIDGDVYDGLSSYRAAIAAYGRFRAHSDEDSLESQADRIRRYVLENDIAPARAGAHATVTVVTGDVHRAMQLSNAMPAVCSAIGGNKFEQLAGVKIVDRQGPANSSTVRFVYELNPDTPTGDWAQAELRRRYGPPISETSKLISFELRDGRQVALDLQTQAPQVWLEDDTAQGAPPAQQVRHYLAEQTRNSNLPSRLRHNPPGGVAARRVSLVKTENPQILGAVLDWYDGHQGTHLNRASLEHLRRLFLARYPDFETFEATSGGYFAEERAYKDALIERAAQICSEPADDISKGARLLDLLTGKEGLPSGLLGWRTDGRIAALRQSHPGLLETAAAELAAADDKPAGIGDFVKATWSALAESQKSKPYSESRNIPTMLAALMAPEVAFGINTDPIQRTAEALLGRKLLGWNPMMPTEYGEILDLAGALREVMDKEWGWKPRDLWDVQGFVWAVNRSDQPTLQDREIAAPSAPKEAIMPTNLILYGPPGTGKTYATAAEAVRLCDGIERSDEAEIRTRYAELVAAGQVRFVTFHQSYAYEDFVEGLRPTMGEGDEAGGSGGGFTLEPVAGVFREVATVAERSMRTAGSGAPFDMAGRQVFKMSLGRAGAEDHIFDAAIEGDYVVLGWGGDIDWTPYESYEAIHAKWNELNPDTNGNDGNIAMTNRFRVDMREGDLIVVSYGNSKFRGIAEVVGPYEFRPTEERDYNHRRPVRWLFVPDEPLPVTFYDKPFTMRSCYMLRERHLNRDALALLLPGQGSGAPAAPPQFVLIIDEINRANISKVFGELITLIEPDKRIGGRYELKVMLPYSKQPFGVPSNLHIVGTMNTADRSIALLDTALRRRFDFRELMPEPERLEVVDGIDLRALLTRINDRIEYLFDREHQIGHAFFMKAKSRKGPGGIDEVMRRKVIPLLAEYFHEDWGKIAAVLGDPEGKRFLERQALLAPAGLESEYGGERYRWLVREPFAEDAYSGLA